MFNEVSMYAVTEFFGGKRFDEVENKILFL